MTRGLRHRRQGLLGQRLAMPGRALAMLALTCQMLFGALFPQQAMAGGDPAICLAGVPGTGGGDDGSPAPHRHHGADCALCPACHVLGAAAILQAPPAPRAAPAAAGASRPAPGPPARAPPASPVQAATYPTGPPDLT